MRKLKTAYCCACLTASALLVGCGNTSQLHSSNSRNQRFLNDIELGGNNCKVNTTVISSSVTRTKQSYSGLDPAKANVLQGKYANMLGVIPQSISNLALYNFIDEWYGVRYRLGGNDKSGIDCSAFVQRMYESVFGINLVRTAFEQFNSCQLAWNTADIQEGDLVFFYTYTYSRARKGKKGAVTGKRISHVGIYLANDHFVHASTSHGVMISSLKETYWTNKFAGAGQVPRG